VTGYHVSEWSDFALAQLGASAALLGLVFVGLSINLRDVIGSTSLVNRAAEGGGGLYWWPAAILAAYAAAISNAWVLLIEILR